MIWNAEDAKTWMIRYATILSSNGNTKASQALLYDLFYHDVCSSEDTFIKALKVNVNLDDTYIQWALKEVRHDG